MLQPKKPCEGCNERAKAKITNSNTYYMKTEESKDGKVTEKKIEVTTVTKPDINKIIADRRKAIADGKIVNK
jgi:hypothetical protein